MIVTVDPKETESETNAKSEAKTHIYGIDQSQVRKPTRHNSYRLFALGVLATVFLLLIICANVQMAFGVSRQLTFDELADLCPDEKEFCYETALLGNCFGKSVKAKLLAKQCKCSCESAQHRRIQNCCRTVGDHDMNFCLPLCGYNTTVNELGSALGLKCVSQLTTWAYCAGDANDNTKCCRGKGVEDKCLSFCKGDVPTCDVQSIFSYQPCLMNLKKILECQMENLDGKPKFDPQWRPNCDWERK
ncbi:hypothetical protein niasHS_002547 [Heterodera schachtii]|uniref:Domain of unknown function DB domain-containing protein n=1 Tax=Heterodera schachtii TaxID=97005 RepID=A0ABD2KKH6_HETSC